MKPYLFVAVPLGLLGLIIAAVAIWSGSTSPRSYIEDTYPRAARHDIGTSALAYISTRPVSAVAEDITGTWRPADRYVDGSGVYLRYSDDAVVIRPLPAGSLILVEAVRTAYPRYYGVLGGHWGWNTRDGEGFRGGGPGAGK
jgi:hypothetical protein